MPKNAKPQAKAKGKYTDKPIGKLTEGEIKDELLISLQETLDNAKTEVAELAASGKDFVDAAHHLVKATTEFNSYHADYVRDQRRESDAKLGRLIAELVFNDLKFGLYVNSLTWKSVDGGGHSIVVNPTERKSSTGRKSNSNHKTKVSITAGSITYIAKDYIDKFGTDADRTHSHYIKWPSELARLIANRLGHTVNVTA